MSVDRRSRLPGLELSGTVTNATAREPFARRYTPNSLRPQVWHSRDVAFAVRMPSVALLCAILVCSVYYPCSFEVNFADCWERLAETRQPMAQVMWTVTTSDHRGNGGPTDQPWSGGLQ